MARVWCDKHGHGDTYEGQCEMCWAGANHDAVCKCGALPGQQHRSNCPIWLGIVGDAR